MPQLLTGSFLEANLACLGDLNADVAERIRQAAPPPGLTWTETPDGRAVPALDGRPLCSRHRPIEEADRLLDGVDLVEHAVIVAIGFGAGYHVQRLADRLGRAGVIVVFEPDVGLLRAVFERIDLRPWLSASLVVWIVDADDHVGLARKLHNAESIIAQGVHLLEHPPSRSRLGERASRFTTMFGELVATSKTTLVTTLVRSVDTTRNLLLNLPHYVGGSGVADLAGAVAGHPAVVVSAGPSLRRNIDQLAAPGVRDRCVIIAAQTTLKPLLAAGVRPHFVTALDYHEISRRFYEDLEPADVAGVTLVADPKANPVILDAFPGTVRCGGSAYLDDLLGDAARDMGTLPNGATVAHLAYYLGRFLGCDPVILIGQDLAFTDGFYYTRGTAIDDIWAPELNAFNTIEMMEWQRIARHKLLLSKVRDINDREIYTDRQMLVYLQQFEREFAADAERGLTTVDATEGGAQKAHTAIMTLTEALDRWALQPLPPLPDATTGADEARVRAARDRLRAVSGEMRELREASTTTADLLRRTRRDFTNRAKTDVHLVGIERQRRVVERCFGSFNLLDRMNQMGVFKRMRADRRIHVQADLGPEARQRARLDRDLDNVTWTADAADEMLALLEAADRRLRGEPDRPGAATGPAHRDTAASRPRGRVAALVPVDPERSALGVNRDLADGPHGTPVIQHTLARLGRSRELDLIVLIVPEGFDVEPLLDRATIGVPVEIERCDGSPFGAEREAIATARLWADTSWRGGIGGMSVYDEVLCPTAMNTVMIERDLAAALLVAPDWPLVDISAESGADAIIARHREHPDKLPLVFTQAPPGIGTCLVARSLMGELAGGHRLARIGPLLVYQPHAPQHDAIARDANVQIDHRIRRALVRATWDATHHRAAVDATLARVAADATTVEIVAALETAAGAIADLGPRQVILELTTDRQSAGVLRRDEDGARRPPMDLDLAQRIVAQLGIADCVLTLGGFGDPLLHPAFDRIIAIAKDHGVAAVHVRTELLVAPPVIARLVASGVDVVSVDLHADRARTYERATGLDRFADVIDAIERLANARRPLTTHDAGLALSTPWIVPRLQRCPETFEDIEPFFDRWQRRFGAALIEGPPPIEGRREPLATGGAPVAVMRHEARRRMLILSDGTVPVGEMDPAGRDVVGSAADRTIAHLWTRLRERREEIANAEPDPPSLRMFRP